MFGSRLDIEQAFGHDGGMGRTRVRRRRLAALAAAVVAVGLLSGPVANAVGVAGASRSPGRTYVVRPGDTLWSIATRTDPSTDPRLLVGAITAANRLDPAALVPGQRLRIPSVG
jgi:Tfp pilus assembly protein FimV